MLALGFVLALASFPSRAGELPIVFARSGQKATLPVDGEREKAGGPLVLWAFDQRWGEALTTNSGAAELLAPKVRVPVVFRLGPLRDSKVSYSELVVYPDRPALEDHKTQWVAVGIPDWFDTWSAAVGPPLRKFKDLAALNAGNWRTPEQPGLLILGRKAAGEGPAAICRFAVEHKINVLVLEAGWFGGEETPDPAPALSPRQMTGGLADCASQRWPLPPVFPRHRLPWFAIANRQTWIAGAEVPLVGYPLVEEIRSPQKGAESLRVVLSYLPWRDQLGRCEVADELFRRLLTETAKGANDRAPLGGKWRLLYPPAEEVKADERPVLAAALKSAATLFDENTNQTTTMREGGREIVLASPPDRNSDGSQEIAKHRPIRGYVLDFRGKTSPPQDLLERLGDRKTLEARIGTESPLLILGDSPVLDTWKWLKLEPYASRSAVKPSEKPASAPPELPPGVLWWRESSLPPSKASQLRLMQFFTEWNISLGDIPQETNYEDRKKQP